MNKLILVPVIIVIAASDFLQLDAARRAHTWGWLGPDMALHWARLFNRAHPDYGSFGHSAKNILSEWVRLDPQRAGKLFAFVIVILLGVILLLGAFVLW